MSAESGYAERITRILSASLGGMWLLDGILQLQPAMFTNSFAANVLAPAMAGQPPFVADTVGLGAQIFNLNPSLLNLAAALVQLLIGIILMSPIFTKYFSIRREWYRFGLWLAAAWALVVWIFGEGFGGLATGAATFYTGAPGAALLYLVLAIYLFYATHDVKTLPPERLPQAVGVLFVFCGALNMMPAFWEPSMLVNIIAIDLLVGLGLLLVFIPNRAVAWTTIGFLAVVWVIGQNFGGIQTFPFGTATDPNAAPLYALFLLPVLIGPRMVAIAPETEYTHNRD